MTSELPSPELLRKLLRYEPDTGKLFWRERTPDMFADSGYGGSDGCCARWNSKHALSEAFTSKDSSGYFRGRVFGVGYTASRVIWAIHTGVAPVLHIDHINGIRTDNRFANLREVSAHENTKNAKKRCDNKSGYSGVTMQGGSWIAQIGGGKTRKYIGSFKTLEDAITARKEAELKYNYHENHGRK